MDDVTASTTVESGCAGPNHRTVLRLGWRRADPLAVSLHVTSEPDHPTLPRGRWSMLRDFLRYALDEPTGDGEVRARPDGDRVVLDLRSAGWGCTVRVPAATVRGFLDATERLVPAGEERSEALVDALIERLTQAS